MQGPARWPVVVIGVYVGLRLVPFVGIAGHASSFPDTYDYQQTAGRSLWSLDFWTWFKPWGTPLLWKLLPGATSTTAPVAQWLISVGAWTLLAAAVYRTLERPVVKRLGFAAVLAFSLVPAIAVWDGALLSESLNLSLAAALVAAMLLLAHEPGRRWAIAVVVVAFLLAGTRATNGYLVPFLLVPLAAVLVTRARWAALALVAGAFCVFGVAYASSNVRQWQVPLGEIIGLRVLHNPGELRYFTARGMPVWPTLEQDIFANRSPLDRFESAPALQRFLPWFNSRARSVYTDYLISHPASTIGDPIRDLPGMVSPSSSATDLQALPLQVYEASGYRNALPGFLNRILYPSSASFLLGWIVAALVITLGFARLYRRIWAVPLILLASTIPHAFIIWTGDDASIGRHALLLAVLLRLGLVILTLHLIDGALRHRVLQGGGAAGADSRADAA